MKENKQENDLLEITGIHVKIDFHSCILLTLWGNQCCNNLFHFLEQVWEEIVSARTFLIICLARCNRNGHDRMIGSFWFTWDCLHNFISKGNCYYQGSLAEPWQFRIINTGNTAYSISEETKATWSLTVCSRYRIKCLWLFLLLLLELWKKKNCQKSSKLFKYQSLYPTDERFKFEIFNPVVLWLFP